MGAKRTAVTSYNPQKTLADLQHLFLLTQSRLKGRAVTNLIATQQECKHYGSAGVTPSSSGVTLQFLDISVYALIMQGRKKWIFKIQLGAYQNAPL